jgi:hypothetical protein
LRKGQTGIGGIVKNNQFALSFCALVLGTLTSKAAAAGCIQLPPNVSAPAVEACETRRLLFFDIAGEVDSAEKGAFQLAFQKSVALWFDAHAVPRELLDGASVDFWLAMPEANPAATQARAVLHLAPRGGDTAASLLVFLSPQPDNGDKWLLDDSSLGFLTDKTYPQSFGFRTGQLLVKVQPGVTSDQLQNMLASLNADASHSGEYAPGWYVVEMPPLQEAKLKNILEQDITARAVVARADFNPLVEWIAFRERLFAFSLSSP